VQNAFFKRFEPLLVGPSQRPIPMFEEAQVPSRLTHIDRLIDFRGTESSGGLLQPIEPWCENRLVALEYESSSVSPIELSMMIAKAAAARGGRRQGKQRWKLVELAQPVTLLLVAESATENWFTRWNLDFTAICRGLWVLEQALVTVVVVRPSWLGQHPGAHLWGLLATELSEPDAIERFEHLLGDPTTATFYKLRAADLLQTRYPESPTMNPQYAEVEEQTTFDASNSRWHQWLELHQAKQELEKENQELRRQAEQERAQTEELRARAKEQRARAEEQQAINERLQAELNRLKSVKGK
jgi:hypothetical protein